MEQEILFDFRSCHSRFSLTESNAFQFNIFAIPDFEL